MPVKKLLRLSLGCLSVLCCCMACDRRHGLMPTSGGRPYEVLVVGSDSEAVNTVAEGLRCLETQRLPQAESRLDVVSIVAGGLTQATRYARNIVLVSTDKDTLQRTRITFERNTYARPQLILRLRAAGIEQLKKYNIYNVRAIAQRIEAQELVNGIAMLRDSRHAAAEQMTGAMFGVELWVPANLVKWKRSNDFLWLSNDAAEGMQNICVYRFAGHETTLGGMMRRRDSVMRLHLPGEHEGSYMTTVKSPMPLWRKVGADSMGEMRGLWEMEGEAMGGPFVSLAMPKGDSTVVAEAFVYAPGMKKRNLMRRLEASLHTLNNETTTLK